MCLESFSFPRVPDLTIFAVPPLFFPHTSLWNAILRDQCGVEVTCGGLRGPAAFNTTEKTAVWNERSFPKRNNLGGDDVRLLIPGFNVSLRISPEFGHHFHGSRFQTPVLQLERFSVTPLLEGPRTDLLISYLSAIKFTFHATIIYNQ